jgi:O-antigen/teichoic acid export membrane protein
MLITEHERIAPVILASCTALNVLFCAVLTYNPSLVGVAASTAATLAAWNVAMAVFIWRRLRLRLGVLAMLQPPSGETGTAASGKGALP